jgi:hypothetical protein
MNDSHREPRSAHNHGPTTRNPMKRACLLGVMAALIAAGTLFTAPAAQAQIKCESTNLSGKGGINKTWPFTTDVTACDGTRRINLFFLQHALLAMVDQHTRQLGDGRQVGKGPVLQAMRPRVFLFNKPSDFNTYFNFWGTKAEVESNLQGVTYTSGLTRPITAVFEYFLQQNRITKKNQWVQIQYIDLTAAHEMGHWFDNLILGTPKVPFSSSPIWTHEMMGTGAKGDYPTFNGLRGKCMGPGTVFNGLKDNFFPPFYICNNNGSGPGLSPEYQKYASLKNIDLLNAAVPNYYKEPNELFAEEAAVTTGDVLLNKNIDTYISRTSQWNCTTTLVLSMLNYGETPGPRSHYQFPSNCPAN